MVFKYYNSVQFTPKTSLVELPRNSVNSCLIEKRRYYKTELCKGSAGGVVVSGSRADKYSTSFIMLHVMPFFWKHNFFPVLGTNRIAEAYRINGRINLLNFEGLKSNFFLVINNFNFTDTSTFHEIDFTIFFFPYIILYGFSAQELLLISLSVRELFSLRFETTLL